MTTINFLTSEFSGGTGGVIYDEILFSKFTQYFNGETKVLGDKLFNGLYENIKTNFVRFNFIYRKKIDEIVDTKYLIVNSRQYTRMLIFPWKKAKDCHLIFIHHHFNFMTESGIRHKIHKYLELKFLKRAALVITPNPYVCDTYPQLGLGDNIILVETETLNNKLEVQTNGKNKYFIYLGNVIERKGLDYGLEAFGQFHKIHPEYQYIIAGKDDVEPEFVLRLKAIIQKYDMEDSVIFKGRVDEAEKSKLLANAYAFLFPSHNEGYGWVMVEAMKHGLPVIAFNNTAMPYTVNDTNGILVENKSVLGLVEAMTILAEDKGTWERLSKGAADWVLSLPGEKEINMEFEKLCQIMETL